MRDHIIRKENGFTLLEVIIAGGVLLIVMLLTLNFMSEIVTYWSRGYSGTSANSSAALAMRKLVLEIQEGMVASVNTDGTVLTVTFPYRANSTSDYSRGQAGVTATYFFSGKTGTETTGDLIYLWKSVNGTKTLLARNVMRLNSTSPPFSVTNGKLVRMDFKGQCQEGTAITPNEIQQSIRLRDG